MKTIVATLSFILLISSLTLTGCLHAQNMVGTWYGTLNVQGTNLHIVFNIKKTGEVYSTTMDSPDQGANGLPTSGTTVTGNLLVIDASALGIKYTGTLVPDSNKINGTFIQGGHELPLVLTSNKDKVGVAAARPQDPKDFPYKQEEVVFTNTKAGNKLAGTLTLPTNGKASKIVILITGSGPQNRNEEIKEFNHRPFLVWSDWLTRNGIAVLRYDDRGIGESTGSFGTATSADFAEDAEAAVAYIQSRADLKNIQIGLLGHSEGGMIAPMIASSNKAVKFLVLLAAPGVPIAQLMQQQTTDQMRLAGTPADVVALSSALNQKVYAAIGQYKDLPAAELKVKMDTMLYQELRKFPETALGGASIDDIVKRTSAQCNSPWFRYFITFDPARYLSQVKCPVLALNGTLDMQVQSTANLAGIKAGLEKAGNNKVEIAPLPGLNHLLQRATTGAVSEYRQITETVNPAALSKVSGWINQL